MRFNRTHNIDEIKLDMIGQKVILGGWVEDLRKLGKITFLTIRDVTGIAQVIVKGELNAQIENLNRQSVLRISGTIQGTKAKDLIMRLMPRKLRFWLKRFIHYLSIH